MAIEIEPALQPVGQAEKLFLKGLVSNVNDRALLLHTLQRAYDAYLFTDPPAASGALCCLKYTGGWDSLGPEQPDPLRDQDVNLKIGLHSGGQAGTGISLTLTRGAEDRLEDEIIIPASQLPGGVSSLRQAFANRDWYLGEGLAEGLQGIVRHLAVPLVQARLAQVGPKQVIAGAAGCNPA